MLGGAGKEVFAYVTIESKGKEGVGYIVDM
jgi:hypothetical protein